MSILEHPRPKSLRQYFVTRTQHTGLKWPLLIALTMKDMTPRNASTFLINHKILRWHVLKNLRFLTEKSGGLGSKKRLRSTNDMIVVRQSRNPRSSAKRVSSLHKRSSPSSSNFSTPEHASAVWLNTTRIYSSPSRAPTKTPSKCCRMNLGRVWGPPLRPCLSKRSASTI